MIHKAIERIVLMELCFDALQTAANADPAAIRQDAFLQEVLRILTNYYENGQWLYDYELDEQGLLPQNLKRGVLAQDAVNDLLDRLKSVG